MHILLTLLLVSLAISSVGWWYFVYFFSVGYGYGIVGLAVTLLVRFKEVLSLPTIALCLLLIVFGGRLGTYLVIREYKSAAYRKILYDESLQTKKPVFVLFMIWTWCALLYVCQVSPIAFRLLNTEAGAEVDDIWAWIGAATILAGILLEAVSDAQKTAAKKQNPKRFVSTGLFSIVRCPNYLGEVIIWTGSLLCGLGASLAIWHWVIVLIGYAGIVFVMFSGARRLEIRQDEVYGDDPEYKAYVQHTPILIPFIPIYSVKKYEWLRA